MEDEQLHSAGSISFWKGAGECFQMAKSFYEQDALTSCLYMRQPEEQCLRHYKLARKTK